MEKQTRTSGTLPIKVSKEIVPHLSIGLYRNFARAVKELISNAYDADAEEVKIKLDLENSRIIVRDDGKGMGINEISEKFLTIGYRTPNSEEIDELGRKRIGAFGIGCLAVFPYCNKLQVITKQRDQNQIIELDIDTNWFFEPEGTLRVIEDAKVPYRMYPSDLPLEVGETIIVLEKIKPHIINEFSQLKPKGKSSLDKFSGFEKFKWTLAQYAPIEYPPDKAQLSNYFHDPATPMKLYIDGEQVFRNVPERATILEMDNKLFGEVAIRYVIMTSMAPIEPEEARGLQIRLRNVAVGLPTDFDVTKFTGKVPGKLNYLCGEVQISQGLTSALMIDRDSFSFTQDIADIHDFFRKKLNVWNDNLEKWASEDKEIYESLLDMKDGDQVIRELREAHVIHFAPERLRLLKAPLFKRGSNEIASQNEKLVRALSKVKDYKVITDKKRVSGKELPVQVKTENKTILIYEEHPDMIETLEMNDHKFRVKYDEWPYLKVAYSICQLSDDNKVVIFNKAHPIFGSRLSGEIIKRLSLGMLLIVKEKRGGKDLLRKLNLLLEHTLVG